MRLSELASKRIINIADGEIMGVAGDSDLLIDASSGLIAEIVLPAGRWNSERRHALSIPWHDVRRIGSEVIVVDHNE